MAQGDDCTEAISEVQADWDKRLVCSTQASRWPLHAALPCNFHISTLFRRSRSRYWSSRGGIHSPSAIHARPQWPFESTHPRKYPGKRRLGRARLSGTGHRFERGHASGKIAMLEKMFTSMQVCSSETNARFRTSPRSTKGCASAIEFSLVLTLVLRMTLTREPCTRTGK